MPLERWKARTLARGLKLVGRVALAFPDSALAGFIGGLAGLPLPSDMRALLREVAEVFRLGPPSTALVRKMLRESRHEELADFIHGSLYLQRVGLE